MKQLSIGILSLIISIPAFAGGFDCRHGVDHKHPACYGMKHVGHRHWNHHHHRPVIVYRNHDWVAPAIVGAIGTAIVIDAMNRKQETQVVVQPPVVQQTQTCTAWVETRQPDGTVVQTRTCQ